MDYDSLIHKWLSRSHGEGNLAENTDDRRFVDILAVVDPQ